MTRLKERILDVHGRALRVLSHRVTRTAAGSGADTMVGTGRSSCAEISAGGTYPSARFSVCPHPPLFSVDITTREKRFQQNDSLVDGSRRRGGRRSTGTTHRRSCSCRVRCMWWSARSTHRRAARSDPGCRRGSQRRRSGPHRCTRQTARKRHARSTSRDPSSTARRTLHLQP